jgi:[ribosomal protein S5]-alanine N-acetyltransferase
MITGDFELNPMTLDTPRLRLELQHPDAVLRMLESLDPATRAEVSPDYLARLRAADGPDPWTCMFVMVDRRNGGVVGQCGFKGAPDGEGMVEIAYGVGPAHQGAGYATEAARALVVFCTTMEGVSRVRAHTKADNPASERVLQKAGFLCLGEVIEPEDGLVNRWEIPSKKIPPVP